MHSYIYVIVYPAATYSSQQHLLSHHQSSFVNSLQTNEPTGMCHQHLAASYLIYMYVDGIV